MSRNFTLCYWQEQIRSMTLSSGCVMSRIPGGLNCKWTNFGIFTPWQLNNHKKSLYNFVYLYQRCYIFMRIWYTHEMSPLFTLVSNAKTLSMNIYQRRDKRQTSIYYCHVLGSSQASGLPQAQWIRVLILIHILMSIPSTSFTFFVL